MCLKACFSAAGNQGAMPAKRSCAQHKNLLHDLPMHLQQVIELYALLANLHQSPGVLQLDDRPFYPMYCSKKAGVVCSLQRRFTYREQILMDCERAWEAVELDSIACCLPRDIRDLVFWISTSQDIIHCSYVWYRMMNRVSGQIDNAERLLQ